MFSTGIERVRRASGPVTSYPLKRRTVTGDTGSVDADSMVERVLLVVTLLPPGRVVTYGDIAGLVGTSARRVGTIMNRYGSGVPWWRVVRSTGGLPEPLMPSAQRHWAAEGIVVAPTRVVPLSVYRADLVALADAYERLREP